MWLSVAMNVVLCCCLNSKQLAAQGTVEHAPVESTIGLTFEHERHWNVCLDIMQPANMQCNFVNGLGLPSVHGQPRACASSKHATQHCQWGLFQPMAYFKQWLIPPKQHATNNVNGASFSPWLPSANGFRSQPAASLAM
jgi:hypothetical protein